MPRQGGAYRGEGSGEGNGSGRGDPPRYSVIAPSPVTTNEEGEFAQGSRDGLRDGGEGVCVQSCGAVSAEEQDDIGALHHQPPCRHRLAVGALQASEGTRSLCVLRRSRNGLNCCDLPVVGVTFEHQTLPYCSLSRLYCGLDGEAIPFALDQVRIDGECVSVGRC